MPAPPKIYGTIVFLLCLSGGAAFPAIKESSTSASRQFIVYGDEIGVRGAMCDLAERTKADFLRLLGLQDDWKTPLLIDVDYPRTNFPDAPVAQLEVSQLGYGLKLQLNVLMTREMTGRAVQRELLRAILVEMMYRGRRNIAAGTRYVTPPDWLVDGVLALRPEHDPDEDADLLRTVIASKKLLPFADLVRQRRAQLDAPFQRLHEAYARALVQLALDLPGGRSRLAQFITDLPDAPNDAAADLQAHFPHTLGRAPEKWWALSIAQLSAADRYRILSAAETAARLDRILRFSIPTAEGRAHDFSLGEYETFCKLPGPGAVLQQVSEQLFVLISRAHPLYRPIVEELHALTDLLARGKARGVPERLECVARYRTVIDRQGREIDDYLNWYEATQSKIMSGAFSQILKTDESSEEMLPRRRDPISVYLDSIEMETN